MSAAEASNRTSRWRGRHALAGLSCAALLLLLLASCGREDADAERNVELYTAAGDSGAGATAVLGRSRALLELLSREDTAGVGRYLHPQFRWERFTGRATPLREDPDFVLRLLAGLPLLSTPLPAEFQLRVRGDSSATVIAHDGCGMAPDCRAPARMLLSWRLTQDGWKATHLVATAEPRLVVP